MGPTGRGDAAVGAEEFGVVSTSAPPLGMGPGLCPSLYGCGWELTVLCCAVVAPDEQVFPTGFPSTPGNVIGVEEVEKLAPLWDFPTSEESHAAMGRPGMIPGVPNPGSRAGLWDAAPIPAGMLSPSLPALEQDAARDPHSPPIPQGRAAAPPLPLRPLWCSVWDLKDSRLNPEPLSPRGWKGN